jgi:histidyl-tRNA synthetase
MEALGVPRGSYVVKVNNRKVLDGVMESIGLGDDPARKLTVLRAIDKYDRLGIEGVKQLLGEGRKDESGDFTKGAGLDKDQIEKIVVFSILQEGQLMELEDVTNLSPSARSERGSVMVFSSEGGVDKSYFVESNKGVVEGMMTHFGSNETSRTGIEELKLISELVEAAGYDRKRIRIDPSVVRGLEYYTGPVYEVELTLETKDEKGRPVRFGSVGGGGRYDGLVSRFRGEPVPATGFSIGVSRLQAALTMLGKLDAKPEFGPVVVTVFDRDRIADYQKMVAALRSAKIRAELYLGNPKNMGNQLKYADRRNSPCVIIQGSDEKARGEVQIKDLIEGARAAAAIASNQEWRETRPAQFSCREDEIVAKVREVLARHEVKWGN